MCERREPRRWTAQAGRAALANGGAARARGWVRHGCIRKMGLEVCEWVGREGGRQAARERREGESQVPWVGERRVGEEERRRRRGFSPRVRLKTTTTETVGGPGRVATRLHGSLARRSRNLGPESVRPPQKPWKRKGRNKRGKLCLPLSSCPSPPVLLPFSPSPLEMQCARGVGTTWPARLPS